MKIAELRAREDFDRTLAETIAQARALDAALDGDAAADAVPW